MTSATATPSDDRPGKANVRRMTPMACRTAWLPLNRQFRLAAACLAAIALLAASTPAHADEETSIASRSAVRVLNDIRSNGADLLSTEGVRIYEDNPLVLGSSIVLGRGSRRGVLLDVDLGESTSPKYRVSIEIEYTRRSLDFDPLIYVTDGRNTVGGRFMEAQGGAAALILGRQFQPKLRPSILKAITLFTDAQLPPVGEQGTLSIRLDVNGITSRVRATLGENDGSDRIESGLDATGGVSLQIARGLNSLQGFQIDSLRASLRPRPCSPADIAEPFGVFNVDDTRAFMQRFNALEDSADLTGDGYINLYDVARFAELYANGCQD